MHFQPKNQLISPNGLGCRGGCYSFKCLHILYFVGALSAKNEPIRPRRSGCRPVGGSSVFRCVLASLYEGLSVRPSVRPSVTLSSKTEKTMILIANNDVSCNLIILQSFHHHEDASLAVWALFSGF